MTFNAKDFAELLYPEQLELLAEFADEFDDDEPEHRNPEATFGAMSASTKSKGSRKKTSSKSKLTQVIQAAEKTLKKKEAQAEQGEAYSAEWNDELDDEVLFSKKSQKRLPAVLTRAEVNELLAASEKKLRDHLVIRTLYATGCRRSELESIKLADLYLDECKVFIRNGKGDKDRYVFIDPKTAELLKDFVYGRALEDPIFDIEDKQINRVVRKWGKKVGINQRYEAMDRHFAAHALRHTFATHLFESGLDVFILRDLLGHRYLGTTRGYVAIGIGRFAHDYRSHHPLCLETKPAT